LLTRLISRIVCRLSGPYRSAILSWFCGRFSTTSKSPMYPSSLRTLAIATRTLVEGIVVSAFRAIPALRIRVSMSLIGSLTLMRGLSVVPKDGRFRSSRPAYPPRCYQLDLVTPGRRPTEASSRKQMRHVPTSACRRGPGRRGGSG
jgi:hypothetical protein